MNTFNQSVKEEIVSVLSDKGRDEKLSALSALIHSAGSLIIDRNGLGLVMEFEDCDVAYFAGKLIGEFGGQCQIEYQKEKGIVHREYKLTLYRECTRDILSLAGIMSFENGDAKVISGVENTFISTVSRMRAYVSGVFLGAGAVSIPTQADENAGYHLELHFSGLEFARDVMSILANFDVMAKCYDRESVVSVYIKDSSAISDVLAIMEASDSVMELNNVLVIRSVSNNANRQRNCNVANIDKTVTASSKQNIAIEKLISSGKINRLSDELKLTAKVRIDNPSDTLDELGEKLGVSKSAVNHRLRKLVALANED